MAIVRKSNRILTVSDQNVDVYLKRGYDQIDSKGNILRYATGGKVVPVAKYNELKAKLNQIGDEGEVKVTVKQIKERLDLLKIEYGANDNKNTLLEKLALNPLGEDKE